MNILHASGTNFQSYETIEFSYNTLGLSLISGDTGAGKSTAMDLVSWCLYGKTSKGTAADDIRSWDATEPTTVNTTVDTPQGQILVTRIRGASNDLYWVDIIDGYVSYPPQRGSNLADTQKLLEIRLGVSADLFIVGSYLTQFSDADTFFVARADRRRDTMEKIADQEWAIKLGMKASEARILAKKQVTAFETELSGISGKLDGLTSSLQSLNTSSKLWQSNLEKRISSAKMEENCFEATKSANVLILELKADEWHRFNDFNVTDMEQQIASLRAPEDYRMFARAVSQVQQELMDLKDIRCASCGSLESSDKKAELTEHLQTLMIQEKDNDRLVSKRNDLTAQLKKLKALVNPYTGSVDQAKKLTNPYGTQLEALSAEVNPFDAQVTLTKESIDKVSRSEIRVNVSLREAQSQVSRLSWLYDKSFELRGLLMQRAVSQVQDKTNYYLEKYFDAAIRITLTLEDSDKLQIMIYNNGHLCSFPSLSGGERCMLKLAFSLSLMRAAQNKAGVAFGMIMLDEPLSGLDDGLKVKAYGLLQELATEYPTVLVIEHSEAFKSMFDRRFNVTKSNGYSSIDVDE